MVEIGTLVIVNPACAALMMKSVSNSYRSPLARTDRDMIIVERRENRRSKGGIVLAVRVYSQNRTTIGLKRRPESSAQSLSLPPILGKLDGAIAEKAQQCAGSVGGAIVDADYSRGRQRLPQTLHNRSDGRLRVERRQNDDYQIDHSSSTSPSSAASMAL